MSTKVYDCLSKISEKIIENKDFLTDLDREIGDADHGVNMARGFQAVVEKVSPDEPDLGAVLKKCGMTLLSTVGGASGPLYGTAYMEAGKVLAGKTELSKENMKAVLEAAIAGIQKRGKAEKGEKTMLDALIPAYDAYSEKIAAGEDIVAGLDAACDAAREGVEFTKTIKATKGRASYLGDRSIGHQDPGATSATMTLETIRDFLKG
ncbi:MAG: dihydroxyacetone kinase subunit L [Lachnospiraceae bacterium]|nr:dihydroxyacetone kinase subunit L [Lachnospiraceae bacterium]